MQQHLGTLQQGSGKKKQCNHTLDRLALLLDAKTTSGEVLHLCRVLVKYCTSCRQGKVGQTYFYVLHFVERHATNQPTQIEPEGF